MMNLKVITLVLMIEPSSWLRSGIKIEKVDSVNLVKFSDDAIASYNYPQ